MTHRETLAAICNHIDQHDRSPTVRELAATLGVSHSAAAARVLGLESEGLVHREGGAMARSVWPEVYPDGTRFPRRADLVQLLSALLLYQLDYIHPKDRPGNSNNQPPSSHTSTSCPADLNRYSLDNHTP